VDRSIRIDGEPAIADALAAQLDADRRAEPPRTIAGRVADRPQIPGDLVGQHLLEPEAEQMRRVAAVGSGEDVAPAAGGTARPPMAGGAAVGQPGDSRSVEQARVVAIADVADAIVGARAETLREGELALEELPAADDGAKRIARDDEA
jgi:hypothetical protein